MFSFLDRWRPKHLAMSWAVYWLGLGAVKLGPAILTAWRLTRAADTDQNAISFAVGNTTMNLSMTEAGRTVYSGSASLTEIALWIAVPPVLLLVAWLFRRSPRGDSILAPAPAHFELGSGLPKGVADREVPHVRRDSATTRREPPADR
jgi:hypothetical protein